MLDSEDVTTDSNLEGDELDRYLASPPEPCRDPVRHWHERKQSLPGLARMGLDYSTIPGASLALFSCSSI